MSARRTVRNVKRASTFRISAANTKLLHFFDLNYDGKEWWNVMAYNSDRS